MAAGHAAARAVTEACLRRRTRTTTATTTQAPAVSSGHIWWTRAHDATVGRKLALLSTIRTAVSVFRSSYARHQAVVGRDAPHGVHVEVGPSPVDPTSA